MSTTTSNTEHLACRTSSRWPANSVKLWAVSHSKNSPRESGCTAGVISQAPAMSSSRTCTSLTLSFVASLGGVFEGPPPGFVVAIPLDGGAQTFGEIGMLWRPTQFIAQLRRINRIPQVVAHSVDNVIEVIGIASHQLEQSP